MRLITFFSLFTFLIVSCGEMSSSRKVSGTVSGSGGPALPMAHVHIVPLGGSLYEPLLTQEVKVDGSFDITLPDFGYYLLVTTGVNHKAQGIPLIADHRDPIRVDIQLAPNDYSKDPSNVAIFGDWNNFNPRAAEPMSKEEDGTYSFELETERDTIRYQLANIEENGHTVNGTMTDFYQYDGGGDYISGLLVEKGRVRITFDPAQLPDAGGAAYSVQYDEKNAALAELASLSLEFDRQLMDWLQKRRAFMDGQEDSKVFQYDFAAIEKRIRDAMADNDNPLMQRFAAVLLGQAAGRIDTFPVKEEDYRQIVSLVPITDPIWQFSPYMIEQVFKVAQGDPEYLDTFRSALAQLPDNKVKAHVLIELGNQAKKEQDIETQKAIYAELDSLYGDMRDLRYYIRNLDPALKIAPGKPVPSFAVQLMKNGKTITDQDFRGKYLLMDFWATWCGPCLGEMPEIHKAYEEFKGDNFSLLSLSFDQTPDQVVEFRKDRWKMPWLHTFVENGFRNPLSQNFEVMGIPKPVLINPEGIIVAVGEDLRGPNLRKTLAEHLN